MSKQYFTTQELMRKWGVSKQRVHAIADRRGWSSRRINTMVFFGEDVNEYIEYRETKEEKELQDVGEGVELIE